MLNYLPKYFTKKSIYLYLAALLLVNVVFFSRALPLIWWVFGIAEVVGFFYFSNKLTRQWAEISEKHFVRRLFRTGLLIRVVWVVFSYFFYTWMTGQPFEFNSADAKGYHDFAVWQQDTGSLWQVWNHIYTNAKGGVSDTGYVMYLVLIYKIFGTGVIIPRLLKALYSAYTCVLIYQLAKRNFGEKTGRMAAIFCMLMPNLIYYTGLHVKEAEMVFITVAFLERADALIRYRKFNVVNIVLPAALATYMFLFRTVLGATALFSLFTAVFLSSKRVLRMDKRLILTVWLSVAVAYFVGGRIATEVETVWNARIGNQETSMNWRAERENGNKFSKYISGAVFAPLIVAIPFPTIINTPFQENQQLINGGNYVKNIMAFFTLFALILLVKEKRWRDHLLILVFMGAYLAVIAMSAFAQSERFHQPVLPLIMLFAAYGVSRTTNKQKKYFTWWLVFIFVVIVGWSWFKLAGRGLA